MLKFLFFTLVFGLSSASAEEMVGGVCQDVAEQAAKVELGQDINYLTVSTYQTQDATRKYELIYDVYVTEEGGNTYLYYVTLENDPSSGVSCEVTNIEAITIE